MHPRTLGYLGRALSLELTAVQQYLTQATLTRAWGLSDAADRLQAEAEEECRHAQRLIERLLARGAVPNASQLKPPGVARSLPELLRLDARLEAEIIDLYAQALAFSRRAGEAEEVGLFAALLAEEQAHARELADWLASLGEATDSRRGQWQQRASL
jgi:bacterioferritin